MSRAEILFRGVLKAIFVAVSCTAAARLATIISGYPTDPVFRIAAPLFCVSLFGTLFVVAFRLGMHGRPESSWAILSYGSWIAIPLMMLLHMFWRNPATLSVDLFWCATGAGLIALFAWGGMRAALKARWDHVATWWICSLPLLFIITALWQTQG